MPPPTWSVGTKTPPQKPLRIHVSIFEAKHFASIFCSVADSSSCPTAASTGGVPYSAPNAFLVVDDFFVGEKPIANWSIEAYVQGQYDRTWVFAENSKPQFFYECIASIPREAIGLPHEDGERKSPPSQQPLTSVRIEAWHLQTMSSAHDAADGAEKESQFWESALPFGTCQIDLKPLKYLNVIDGWFKIVSNHHSVEAVVGYLRAAVRVLP
jgi:hypothetical protein